MQIHNISPKTKFKKKRYIGHGGKKGTYSGKGIKGQRSRTGARIRPQIRDVIKRVPKFRGYDQLSMRRKKEVALITLAQLEKHFQSGDTVDKKALKQKGIIKLLGAPVKILNNGKLTKVLKIEKIPASKSAIEAILKAGGQYV
jgi:large subunit ribosomal protein L15